MNRLLIVLPPPTKGGQLKIQVSEHVLGLLKYIHDKTGNPRTGYVLRGPKGTRIKSINRSWENVRAAAGITDVRLHDGLEAATDRIVGATRGVAVLTPPPFERLTDRQWKRIAAIVEATRGTCGGTRTDLRRAVDAIRWVLHNGAKWREMPKNLGSPTTCWRWYERWCGNGTWARITAALDLPEIEVGREPRHAQSSGARPKPTIEVEAVEVSRRGVAVERGRPGSDT